MAPKVPLDISSSEDSYLSSSDYRKKRRLESEVIIKTRHLGDIEREMAQQLTVVFDLINQRLSPPPQQPPQIMEAQDGSIDIERLGYDLLLEVLWRVPVGNRPACKCVSKQWRDLIADPSFLENHLKVQTVLQVKKGCGSGTFQLNFVNGRIQSYGGYREARWYLSS